MEFGRRIGEDFVWGIIFGIWFILWGFLVKR
jgi:hypothetical protein